MRIIAIDPGTTESAYVVYEDGDVVDKGILPNEKMCGKLSYEGVKHTALGERKLAVEMVASYGMPVGKDVFETCVWIGRFIEAWGGPYEMVYRQDVKLHLCKDTRAKDSNIRQAILDLYPPSGGGKTPQVGTKDEPGPLYGFRSHLWSALAVAITAGRAA